MTLHYSVLQLETRHEFHIARAAAPPKRQNVWLRLIDDDAIEGWGEAAPSAYYGETADTVIAAFERMRPVLAAASNVELEHVPAIEQQLLNVTPADASARAAVSAALFDLAGQRAGRPVHALLDLDPQRAPRSSFTIGIAPLDAMREKVREAASYPILKIKVGTPEDEAILAMLREERPDAIIRVDANTGWTVEQALANLPMLEDFRVELIEQPLPPDDLAGLAAVTRASRIPIIADESCKVAADVTRLAGCVHGMNIKLSKCGSMLEAMRIEGAARKLGMQVMIGCMIESTLGIAAAIQLSPLADYVDLDGAALLANDPFRGPAMLAAGRLQFNAEPGLGVTTTK